VKSTALAQEMVKWWGFVKYKTFLFIMRLVDIFVSYYIY